MAGEQEGAPAPAPSHKPRKDEQRPPSDVVPHVASEELDPNIDKCGFFNFRPAFLQPYATPKWILFNLSMALFVQGFLVNGCLNVVLPTIERRFQLRSFESGTILSSYNVANCLVIVPAAFLGSQRSKPLFLSAGMFAVATGSLIFSLPHFFAEPYTYGRERKDMCPADNSTAECIESDVRNWRFVLMLGHMINGAGVAPLHTLGIAYMDENLPKRMTASYIGVYTCMGIIGPAFGFVFAGYFLTFYEDFSDVSKLGLTSKSSVWVGAWWTGFLFGSIVGYIITIPMTCFPRRTPDFQHHGEQKHAKKSESRLPSVEYGRNLKELPHAVTTLLKNCTFIFLVLGGASEAMMVNSIAVFATKFYQSQFAMTPASAALIIGVVSVTAGCGGTFLGGVVVTRLDMKTRSIIRMCWFTAIIPWFTLWVFALSCPNPTFAFNKDAKDLDAMFTFPCNAHCNCHGDVLNPICSVDNVVHFSPCFAGCTEQYKSGGATAYANCSCIESAVSKALESDVEIMEQASRIKCPTNCKLMLPVTISVFIGVLLTLFNTSPAVTATIRCVAVKERATALAVKWMALRLFGSIPAPLILGAVIDKSCVVWHQTCSRPGSCIYYDNKQLANNMLYALLPMKTLTLLFYFCAYHSYEETEEERAEGQTKPGNEMKPGAANIAHNVNL